ncbi:MAG: ABC transporter permease [Candidatus Latescibacterota bacterium]|jgi:lipopolysaccharide transport system permease protein
MMENAPRHSESRALKHGLTAPSPAVRLIQPSKSWLAVDWKELWLYRDLFFILVQRDIKIRYKQTLLGITWSVLVPLIQMLVFTVISLVAGNDTDNLPRPVFYFSAMLVWNFFATAFAMSANSLVGNISLLTKIYFPRVLIPASPCLAGLVDLAIALPILLGLMLYYGLYPAMSILILPVFFLMAFATALGFGLVFSALNVKFRDIRYVVPPLVQIWAFCSVFLSFNDIHARFAEQLGGWVFVLYGLNPMGTVIEGVRWCLLHHEMGPQATPPWTLLLVSTPVVLLILSVGLVYFRRMERMFADVA